MADTHGQSGAGSSPGTMWVYCLCGWQSEPVSTTEHGWMEAMLGQYNDHIAGVTG